jgi:hypothetical protein
MMVNNAEAVENNDLRVPSYLSNHRFPYAGDGGHLNNSRGVCVTSLVKGLRQQPVGTLLAVRTGTVATISTIEYANRG